MIKNVCCSFDNEHGMVYVTCNNGVHPDRNGHHSRTVVMPREHFLRCCQNRELFNEPLGRVLGDGFLFYTGAVCSGRSGSGKRDPKRYQL